jgi:hypothetical protein
MPPRRVSIFNKEAQRNSAFGKAISAGLTDINRKLMNAVEFIEGPQGTGIVLRPVQRVIAKCIFGVPLDWRPEWADRIPLWGQVQMWDVFREKLIRTVSEEEYLHIAFNENRCNIDDWRDIPNLGKTYGGYNEAVVFAGRRGGKALALDEPIPTPNGFVRNGDIKDGDMVLSPSGKPTKVVYAHEPFVSEVYCVTFDDGTSVLAHPEHRWLTFTRADRMASCYRTPEHRKARREQRRVRAVAAGYEYAPRPEIVGLCTKLQPMGSVKTTQEIFQTLKVGNYSNHAIPLPRAVELPDKDLPLDPYCFGCWLGDGESAGGNYAAEESDALEILKYFVSAGFSWKKSKRKHRWSIRGLKVVLRKMGVLGNKHIPNDYLWASSSQRKALLQGLLDTDGGCSKGLVTFTNTRRNLSEGVYHLAASLGLKPYWKEVPPRNPKHKVQYWVTWTGESSVFRLQRKLNLLSVTVRKTQKYRYVVSIEPAGRRMVRCLTVEDPDGLFLFGKNFNITHNSELVAAITCFKLYLLLNIRSPQEFFGLVPGSPIDITYLAQDDTGADRLFKKLSERVNHCSFFEPFVRDNNSKKLTFVCEADRHKRDITPTLTVWSLPCSTNAVRGPSSVFLALDEFAHFRAEKGSTSEDMYAAATPSTVDFHHTERIYADGTTEAIPPEADPDNEEEVLEEDISAQVYEKNILAPRLPGQFGVQDSMIFSISSPLKRVGKMYELHKLALSKGAASSIFTLNCSTAEMNNKVLSKTLRADHEKNPLTFRAEFGGQFLESSESYVTEAAVKSCVDCHWDETGLPTEGSTRLNVVSFIPQLHLGRNYFWGFDLGMICDASALAIAHLEYGGGGGIRLIYDYIDRMMVGEHFTGPFIPQAPGEKRYENYKVLPLEDILVWMKAINRILPCFRGATDQHGGQQLAQLLELNGIFNFEMLNITPAINSQMAYALRGYIENKLCSFPYEPKFIKELKLVELEVASKYRIRVQAPMEKGAHDDMADAAMLCALLAQNWLVKEGNVHMDPKGIGLLMQQQQSRPPAPLSNIDGVPLSTLKVMERTKKLTTNLGYSSGTAPRSPWSRRGGRHR